MNFNHNLPHQPDLTTGQMSDLLLPEGADPTKAFSILDEASLKYDVHRSGLVSEPVLRWQEMEYMGYSGLRRFVADRPDRLEL